MGIQRTPEQEAVVVNRGGGLLVSAAAGSGKTRVLVERLLDRIQREEKNVDEFLIITFTRAAAEELRARIGGELLSALREHPENAHLKRQKGLLYQAQISTIHAFCTVLLRQCGHTLDIPTDFTLCEDEEATVLMLRTLDELLEARYENLQPESEFGRLVDILSAGRDDSRLIEITLDVYAHIQSHPNPRAWLEEQRKRFDFSDVTDMGQTVWGEPLLCEAAKTAGYWAGQLEQAIELTTADEVLEKNYKESLSATREGLLRLITAAQTGWDAAAEVAIPYPTPRRFKGIADTVTAEQVKAIRKNCKKATDQLAETFVSKSADLLADLDFLSPAMKGLISLVEDFSDAYDGEKRKRGMLDFSDLEHCAVKLLYDEEGNPSELARQWGAQYAEIMVDEYQDTNEVQNAIFDALSDKGRNLFMVGDVKQSIYRFRLADPTIFLRKYNTFKDYTEAAEGEDRKITMSKNFRSRPEVLEATNALFRSILSPELGEMAYTDEVALYPGGTFPEGEGYETELHFLNLTDDPALTQDREDKNYLEAQFVARRIARMLQEGFPVSDGKGGTRPVCPEDIAILLRSPNPVRPFYTRALEEQEIQWSADGGEDLFQTTEVSVALSYLQIIDNPRQDIPLIAVLRSPLYGFTGDKLAELRLADKGDYFTALRTAAEAGDEDCKAFLSDLESLRFGAGEQSCHDLLWALYRKTGMPALFGALPGGERRQENLTAFRELARRFEGSGHKGLFSFLLHLERVQQSGGVKNLPGSHGSLTGVKILSIHRSKGLEYPVVFLCGLGRGFNKIDLKKPVLFHHELGLGPNGVDRETMVKFSTPARTAVKLKLEQEMLSEEMRLLYVAMTRAKEKLILTAVLPKKPESMPRNLSLPVDPQLLSASGSMGEWLFLTAMARPEGASLRNALGVEEAPLSNIPLGPPWKICYHSGAVSEAPAIGVPAEEGETALPLSIEEIKKRLLWQDSWKPLAAAPAKVTATQLPHEDVEGEAACSLPGTEEPVLTEYTFHRPRFAQERLGLTAAQKGTALHTLMQCVRLDRTNSVAEIQEEVARLTGEKYLTAQEAQSIDVRAAARFFASPIGRELRENPNPHREFPFSLLVEADRFFPDLPAGETMLLQGVIDCWFQRLDGITLLDFKTDRVTAAEASDRAERYRIQMNAYRYALERMTGQRVSRCVLWFLKPGVPVELEG